MGETEDRAKRSAQGSLAMIRDLYQRCQEARGGDRIDDCDEITEEARESTFGAYVEKVAYLTLAGGGPAVRLAINFRGEFDNAMPCGHPCRTTAEADCTGSLSIHVAKVGSVSTVLH